MPDQAMGTLTVRRIRGIVGGAAILTLFGGWWCIEALAFWTERPIWAIPAGTAASIVLLALCILRLVAAGKTYSLDDPGIVAKHRRAGRIFAIVFGIECGLIGLCSGLLMHYGRGIWIPIAIAIIVGIHFLPLARIFELPLYYWTGILSVLGALGCLLISDFSLRLLSLGLMMAAVLWLTAVMLLLQTDPLRPARL